MILDLGMQGIARLLVRHATENTDLLPSKTPTLSRMRQALRDLRIPNKSATVYR